MSEYRKILVTGTQRSGSTWLGNILASSSRHGYIHEPFNKINHLIHDSPIDIPYMYIDKDLDKEKVYSQYLDYFLNPSWRFLYNSVKNVKHVDSRYISPLRQHFDTSYNPKVKIIKDPFALFSADWLHNELGWEILVICRHPAAYALSMMEKGWILTPTVFKEQSMQLQQYFGGNVGLIDSYVNKLRKKDDFIGSAILAWNLQYMIINYYREKYPHWTYVLHEELSHDPVNGFSKVFSDLKLNYDSKVQAQVSKTTQGQDASGANRDVRANLSKWKNRLNKDEIDRIKTGTYPLWTEFYRESDW